MRVYIYIYIYIYYECNTLVLVAYPATLNATCPATLTLKVDTLKTHYSSTEKPTLPRDDNRNPNIGVLQETEIIHHGATSHPNEPLYCP